VRIGDDILVIPTGASLGALTPDALSVMLQGHTTRPLTPDQVADLRARTAGSTAQEQQ
jgi:hypothetical protein